MRQSVAKQDVWGSGARGRPRRTALGGAPKRAFDLCVAGVALVLLSPIALAAGLLIRLLLGKPVVVAEGRIGFEGKVFACYKFRTKLTEGAETSGFQSDCQSAERRMRALDQPSWVDVLGRCLRASDLDKLPQLVNVLRGDMSLVGPQPITPEHMPIYCAQAPEVLLARPGMTGMWSSTPRSLGMHATEMALDRHYVNHWSMWLDLKIVWGALARARA